MERVMTVEEKIRRAEEIYQKRRQGETRPIAKVAVNEKKDMKLLRKMIIQILVCVGIYLGVYAIQHNQYIFSEDFINKANEILSYDTNFTELYEMVKNSVVNWMNEGEKQEEQSEQPEAIPENEQNAEGSNVAIGGAEEQQQENIENLSQEEQEIQKIKSTSTFIKPVIGTISSKYGHRESSTASVPINHTVTDIACNLGTKIVSATDGEVVLASEEGDYGKHLKIQIGEVSVIYAHCNSLYVKQGDKITQGQEIAEVGSTRQFYWSSSTF